MSIDHPSPNRRDFLTGRSARVPAAGIGRDGQTPDATPGGDAPTAGNTLRLSTRAMACEFSAILNPGEHERVMLASEALDLVHALEDRMTVYRESSDLSQINRNASEGAVGVDPELFDLLRKSCELSRETDGAFDPTSGPLVALWRACRDADRIPTDDEIAACLTMTGVEHVEFDDAKTTVRFARRGVELNLGGIGKGYALDRIGISLHDAGLDEWLLHGGHSSLLARGDHNQTGGWPVGIGNPLFTDRRLGTILLRDQAMSTSGSNIQYFRHQGRRYGHILDPRTGWPVEGTLSVTVVAASAAVADALSTAFFVLGVENTRRCCDNLQNVGVILIPYPDRGRLVQPVVIGIPEEQLFWDPEQVARA